MNRITNAIDKIGKLESQDAKLLDMDLEEHYRFQELKSLAFAEGNLSFEEATTVYSLLGETVNVFNGQDWATKAVLTKLFLELLKAKLCKQKD